MSRSNLLHRLRAAAAPLAALSLLAACATATPYQPLGVRGAASGGYSEQRLEENRYRVSFTGNEFTSRQRVENYLLYRAAELTLQAGYDGFTMVTRGTDPHTRTTVSRDPFYGPWGGGPWGYWGPSWRFRGRGFGWRTWDPWIGDPFWADNLDVSTVTSFEASAEIVMFRGRRADDPRSFDAHQVVANLGPTVQGPPR
jgi:hypothetical protein